MITLRALALRATCMVFVASQALLAGCSMSISTGAVDYGELEREITETLNGTYAGISRQVSEAHRGRGGRKRPLGDPR